MPLTRTGISATIDSMSIEQTSLAWRSQVHRALGDPHRLQIVDALRLSDRSPSELLRVTELSSNLLAFHLDVLEEVGLIARRRSSGDARRRYVTLRWEALTAVEGAGLQPQSGLRSEFGAQSPDVVVFVCTHNSARSQMAAALWREAGGGKAVSAGTDPAQRVHPLAVEVAGAHGVDLSAARPRSYSQVDVEPHVVVSVCDRAREAGTPWRAERLHWSVADPAGGDRNDFERAYTDIDRRVRRLADAVETRS